VIFVVVLYAVGDINDGLIFLKIKLETSLYIEWVDTKQEQQPSWKQEDVGIRILDSLDKNRFVGPFLLVLVVLCEHFILEVDNLLLDCDLFVEFRIV